jgi:hypothetical protein
MREFYFSKAMPKRLEVRTLIDNPQNEPTRHPMFNDRDNDHTSKLCSDTLTLPNVAHADFTAKLQRAKAASDALNANDKHSFDLAQLFGETLTILKADLKHGQFGKVCKDALNRSASSCALYMRAYESREDMHPALAWAVQTGHRWAHCRSVERVLKVIADWKMAQRGESPAAPRARRNNKEILAQMQQRLDEDDAEFIAMRDDVPLEVGAKIELLAAAASAGDDSANEEIAKIARQFHWRRRDLVVHHQISSALQVSEPTAEVPAEAQPDAPKPLETTSDQAISVQDHGYVPDSSGASAAPTTALHNLDTAPRLEDGRRPSGEGALRAKIQNAAPAKPAPYWMNKRLAKALEKLRLAESGVTSSPRKSGPRIISHRRHRLMLSNSASAMKS